MADPVIVGSTWSTGVPVPSAELRRVQAAAFGGSAGTNLGGHGGIVRHADGSLAISVNASDVLTILRGSAVIPGNAVAGSGVWIATLLATATVTLDPRHVTNPRVDLVILRQLDVDVVPTHGAGVRRAQIEVLTGTPDPAPQPPALPDMAIELGRVTVYPSGGAAAVVDRSYVPYATGLNGTYLAATFARLPLGVPKWSEARALDTGTEYTFNGTAWTTAAGGLKQATGIVSLSDGGAEPNTKTVSLPAGLFSSPPAVFLQPDGVGAAASTAVNHWTSSRTSSSFVANVRRSSATVMTFTWLAVGS